MAHVVGELQDFLQCECGEGEALPDNVFHDMMLQVHVHTFSLSTLFTNPFLILFKPESALFTYFNISFFFRESGRFGSVPNCRRWAVNASMRAGLTSTMPWLEPTCPTSGKCALSCLGILRRTNWCLASSILLPPRNFVLRQKRKRPRLVRPLG